MKGGRLGSPFLVSISSTDCSKRKLVDYDNFIGKATAERKQKKRNNCFINCSVFVAGSRVELETSGL